VAGENDKKDWIESFMTYMRGIPAPEIFKLWSGISAISGALERRVWTDIGGNEVYPNLYILLIAPPGIGKSQAVAPVRNLWRATGLFNVAPSNASKAAFLDIMERKVKFIKSADGQSLDQYNALLVANGELSTFLPTYDTEFLSVLNDIFDNPPIYNEERRFNKKVTDLINPYCTMLLATQPAQIAAAFPEEAWKTGFTARLNLIYSAESQKIRLWQTKEEVLARKAEFKALVKSISLFEARRGVMIWKDEAMAALYDWYLADGPPTPQHHRLENYLTRRHLHLTKLSMIAAASRSSEMVITMEDFERARTWLIFAEQYIPDAFLAMKGRSDGQLLSDLSFAMWKLWIERGKKPVDFSEIHRFLSERAPSDKISRLVEVAENIKIIVRLPGTNLFNPAPPYKMDLG
jgi:hypothetical protein